MLLGDISSNKKEDSAEHLKNIITGIIEGETRVIISSMTMEEIFTEREEFSKTIHTSPSPQPFQPTEPI